MWLIRDVKKEKTVTLHDLNSIVMLPVMALFDDEAMAEGEAKRLSELRGRPFEVEPITTALIRNGQMVACCDDLVLPEEPVATPQA